MPLISGEQDDMNERQSSIDTMRATGKLRLGARMQQILPQMLLALALVLTACSSSGPENNLALCSDGQDNDGDGMTDCSDSDCYNSPDPDIIKYCTADTNGADVPKKPDGKNNDIEVVETADVGTKTDAEVDTGSQPICPGGFGCKCIIGDDCDSGACINADQGKVCTKFCGSCPTDWKCVQQPGGDLTYVCLPAYPNLCMPCKDHKECQTNGSTDNYCVPFDKGTGQTNGFIDGHFCMAACVESKDDKGNPIDTCKSGYHCQTIKLFADAEPVKQCVPDSNECGCQDSWAQEGKSTECHKTSQAGTCTSKRQCQVNSTGEAVLTTCDADTPAAEVCGDDKDNDCNGLTDEPGAGGCTNYYLDNDGDGFGVGAANTSNCLCNDPGIGYSKFGNDCNDMSTQFHPGAVEICNNVDDNCNGETDESGSKGCTVYYHDLDGDGFGSSNDSSCMCKSKQTSEWILQTGDCDDTPGSGAKIHPGVDEACDAVDNNCNGKTDEQGAIGCKLYYVDQDGDTYGVTSSGLCLCAPTSSNKAGQPGDCDDGTAAVNPSQPEICDNIDNDCDGKTDGKAADASCGVIAAGKSKCLDGGICGTGGCDKGFYDINNDPTDGCECKDVSSVGNLGIFCGVPIDAGILGDGGASIQKAGQILPGEGGDWYTFKASDSQDVGTSNGGNCDQYDVHIAFVLNPGNGFVFDVFRGSCGAGDQACSAETVHDWSTAFYGPVSPFGPKNKANSNSLGVYQKSPTPEIAGECNCVPANAKFKACKPSGSDPYNDPDLTGCGPNGLPGMNLCSDNSSVYFVRVYAKPGTPLTCEQYIIKFDNGYAPGSPPPQN
jgi:hypothetical protein